jgi:hypothetical protein
LEQPWWESREKLALSISEAAQVCGVRRRTIRRRHQAGEFEHAFKDPDGSWRIPVNDLIAAGLRPNVVADPDEPRIVFTAASQVDRLRMEVAVLHERVRALEIIARERGERVTDLRTILRMLPAPKEAEEVDLSRAEEAPPAPEEPLVVVEDEGPSRAEDEIVATDTEANEVGQELLSEVVTADVSQDFSEDVPADVQADATTDITTDVAPDVAPDATGDATGDATAEVTSPGPFQRTQVAQAPFRATSPFDAPQPIVILPDEPSQQPEPSEGGLERSAELLESARQRSAELLEDAMSMWWPSSATRPRPEEPPRPAATDQGERTERDLATETERSWTQATRAVSPAPPKTSAEESASSPPAMPKPSERSDLFTRGSMDEASLDWLDPDFGRPPGHLRRRLGRFFKRNRRPQ